MTSNYSTSSAASNGKTTNTLSKELRSLRSDVGVLVTFISRTQRPVVIYWYNFNGQRVEYCRLNYGSRLPIRTFETHPWIFRDSRSGDTLITSDGHDVFWPRRSQSSDKQVVIIGIPVYSLRERCIQVVRCLLSPNEIKEADIPSTLKDELLVEL